MADQEGKTTCQSLNGAIPCPRKSGLSILKGMLKPFAMVAIIAGISPLLPFWTAPGTSAQSAESVNQLVATGEKTDPSKVTPKTDVQNKRNQPETPLRSDKLPDTELVRRGRAAWERMIAENPLLNPWENPAWKLAQSYVRQGEYDKAIEVYKPHCNVAADSTEQRAELGEVLLFGKVGARSEVRLFGEVKGRPTVSNSISNGKGQCPICHRMFKEEVNADLDRDPFQPYLFNFAHRIKGLIASSKYQHRPEDTMQPEAFPGSGKATNLIEYLAESNVCPSCYIAPRIGFTNNPRESLMPGIQRPPISLTIDEMVAIDTWLLKREGEQIPSLKVMRAAYEKFLQPYDRVGSYEGILLASLYDAKGDLDTAIQLLEANYPGLPGYMNLELLRDAPRFFANLKKRTHIVARFPNLLQVNEQP